MRTFTGSDSTWRPLAIRSRAVDGLEAFGEPGDVLLAALAVDDEIRRLILPPFRVRRRRRQHENSRRQSSESAHDRPSSLLRLQRASARSGPCEDAQRKL